MLLGYRIISEGDIGRCNLSFAQLSIWNNGPVSANTVKDISGRCSNEGIRYVIHPLNYPISETNPLMRRETLDRLKRFAEMTDLGLIIHDETIPGNNRLCNESEAAYREGLREIEEICPVAIENANNSIDAVWFWRSFASSVTLDIGHLESAGLDSVETIESLPNDIVEKISYVHLHHNNGEHYGITDHWPLKEGCREVAALSALLRRKSDIKVILEIDGRDGLSQSIQVLQGIITEDRQL